MSGEGLELDGRIAEAGLYGPTEWARRPPWRRGSGSTS